jgi:hypothetical protein
LLSEEAILHQELLLREVDQRVFIPLFLSARGNEPALYRSLIQHRLVVGSARKRGTRSKLLQPDFSMRQLEPEQLCQHVARFVAKAIADGSLQALLLAAQLVMCCCMSPVADEDAQISLPLGSHLRVLISGASMDPVRQCGKRERFTDTCPAPRDPF